MTKQQAINYLKDRYLSNMKEGSELFVGVELEFPIVETNGNKTNIEVTKKLFQTLAGFPEYQIEKKDQDNNPIQLIHIPSKDRILFELSYNTIEFAFERAHSLREVAERFESYLSVIQPILREDNHELQGMGIHPQWKVNDNRPVKIERYKMLMAFLAMKDTEMETHGYPSYGAFICGNQVQLDVRRDNYLRIINAFNKIEAAKAYLFSNSEFTEEEWDTKIARDIFWEKSLHGYFKENVGIYPKDYKNEEEFFDNLSNNTGKYQGDWARSSFLKNKINDLNENAIDIENIQTSDVYINFIKEAYKLYIKQLYEANIVDFSYLQVEFFNMLIKNKEFLEKINHDFEYIMVDEYQDSNKIQEKILLLISKLERISVLLEMKINLYIGLEELVLKIF